jgi:hypothetical protein
MNPLLRGALATLDTAKAFWMPLARQFLLNGLEARVKATVSRTVTGHDQLPTAHDRLASYRAMQTVAEDGCVRDGAGSQAWAKYAIPKGLPVNEGERRLAIENDPHYVDDFDGEIATGYGKGTKTLLTSDIGVVKIAGRSELGKVNYHRHDADVAGPHYDLVVSGVHPDTPEWELHIPRGEHKGRYAFRQTGNGAVIVRMKDRSILLPKPEYRLKPRDFLIEVERDPGRWIVERKYDGSLGNVAIHKNRAHIRSHRESANAYYDKLPGLEFLDNRSRLWSCRKLFPGPDADGTVLQVELVHPDGAARVSGILNALPEKARRAQEFRGDVHVYVWDIKRFRGRDVTNLPYENRRELYLQTVKDIQRFNKNWHAVEELPATDARAAYERVVADPRGLPYAEGVIVKERVSCDAAWVKVKAKDTQDLAVVSFIPGTGKYADTLGAIVVEHPGTGTHSEVGSFRITDAQRDLIWAHREELTGQVAEIDCMQITDSGAVRAGVFVRWHPSKSEGNLFMTADTLAGSNDPEEATRIKYRLINSH